MTDGLIQQAFEKHLRELCKSEYFDEVMFANFVNYKYLEQELIEKIKQEIRSNAWNCATYGDIINLLVGDNQE